MVHAYLEIHYNARARCCRRDALSKAEASGRAPHIAAEGTRHHLHRVHEVLRRLVGRGWKTT